VYKATATAAVDSEVFALTRDHYQRLKAAPRVPPSDAVKARPHRIAASLWQRSGVTTA